MIGPVRAAPLGPAFDLLAAYTASDGFFFERDGLGVAAPSLTGGVEIGGPDLAGLARAVASELRGSEAWAVAVGALPFQPGPASVWVPPRAVQRADGGETWLIEMGEGDRTAFEPERVAGELPHEAFRAVQLREEPEASAYGEAVRAAVGRIESGGLSKVVLARTLEVEAGRSLDPRRLVHRLRAVEPHCYTFAAPTGQGPPVSVAGANTEVLAELRDPSGRHPDTAGPPRARVLVGASPELLVSRRGDRVRSTPLAGTAPRAGDLDEDVANAEELAASSKNREEHAIVVEAVAEVLGSFCDELSFDAEPVLEPTANVWHLATRFEGALRDPATTALDLVAELHPTPAVCGTPRDDALAAISALEGFDRGAYAGPVGWVDARGDGDWAIALRCASLGVDRATLYAGAGIVSGSEAAGEIDETDRKFRAFLDSLRWG